MSDVLWAPNKPDHWGGASLRWLADIFAGGTPNKSNLDYWTNGTIPWLNSGAVNDWIIEEPSAHITQSAYSKSSVKWIPKRSVVIALAGQGKTKGTAARLEMDSTCNQSMAAIVPNPKLDFRFLHFWLASNYQNIRNLAGGDKRDGLNLVHVAGIQVPLPPVDEQQVIANFLDYETQKIDELITEQRGLIEILRERRMATVSDAVFALGERAVPLRRMAEVVDCAHVTAEFVEDDTHYAVASIAECQGRYVDLSAAKYTTRKFFDHLRAGNRAPRPGDLLFIRNASVGLVAAIANGTPDFAVGQETVLLRRRSGVLPDFLRYSLTSARVKHDINRAMIGSTFKRINVSSIRSLPIPLMPVDEQQKIVDRLDDETNRIDELISESEDLIALSQERRAALITAAVTGQIDVRRAA